MLTIFTIAKAFTGHENIIQINAIESWLRLAGDNEIILFGDDPGVGEVAARYGLRHVGTIARSAHGTPLISDAFTQADQIARHDILCFVNTDIILFDDFPAAIGPVAAGLDRFLMVGRRTNLEVTERLDFNGDWQATFSQRVEAEGRLHPWQSSDYFVFPRHVFVQVPPFAIGRTSWDNWLMYEARRTGVPLVDATPSVRAVHQNHGYVDLVGGEGQVWKGVEVDRNFELAGGRQHIYTVYDATFILKGRKLVSAYWPWYWPRFAWAALDRSKSRWLADHPRIHQFLRRLRGRPGTV